MRVNQKVDRNQKIDKLLARINDHKKAQLKLLELRSQKPHDQALVNMVEEIRLIIRVLVNQLLKIMEKKSLIKNHSIQHSLS